MTEVEKGRQTMANDDFFENFLRQASNYNGMGGLEFYEDTHDSNGKYIGGAQQNVQPQFAKPQNPYQSQAGMSFTPPPAASGYVNPQQMQMSAAAQRTDQTLMNNAGFSGAPQQPARPQAQPLPTTSQYISPQLNQNFVIYRPRTTADVEQLIAYLRRREPALVDLDPISDSPEAQRLMDFVSGAAYALGDRVMTIRRNLFLITPETIDVLKPESDK